jgi:hypothetical protein
MSGQDGPTYWEPPRDPEWTREVAITSTRTPEDALEQLRIAIAQRRYSVAGRECVNFYRLGGDVTDPASLLITGQYYVIPGLIGRARVRRLRVRGRLIRADDGDGCVLVGQMSMAWLGGPDWLSTAFGYIDRGREQVSEDFADDFARFLAAVIRVKASPRSLADLTPES